MRWSVVAYIIMLLPLIAVAQTARPSKWTLLPLAHPDAKLLLGIDWRRVKESPLGPIVLKQVQQGGHPLLGFLESIENVDRLLVSSSGSVNGAKAPLLVIGEGRFALPKIRAMAKADGAVSRKYNDVELLVPPNATNADLHFALVDGSTILVGDGTSVKGAIDRWLRADTADDRNPLFFRATTLATTQEIWAAVTEPSTSLSSLGISSSPIAEQIKSLELGLLLGQTLSATLWINAASEEAADTLATGLPALLQLAALQYSDQPSLTQLAKRLKVISDKGFVKMAVTIDGKLFEQSMSELRAAAAPPVTRAVAAPVATHQPPIAAPVVPTGPRVVRIVGMDEGVKEIPYEVKTPE
jgi:hypothetical protein